VVDDQANRVGGALRSIFLLIVNRKRLVGLRLVTRVVLLHAVLACHLLGALDDVTGVHDSDLLRVNEVGMVHFCLQRVHLMAVDLPFA